MITIIAIICIYLYIIKPNRKIKDRTRKIQLFIEKPVAHRGLYLVNKDGLEDYPENSLPSFKRAVEYGLGIELDVRLTKDNKLVVFHDKTLKRMCGVNRKVSNRTYRELMRYSLLETSYKIPTFRQVINEVNGDAPLLIEIKADKHTIKTTKILLKQLQNYGGPFVIESFSPFALIYLRIFAPEIIRGQLVSDYIKGKKINSLMDIILNGMLLNFISKPDFIASNHKYVNKLKYKIMRKLYDYWAAGWTIKSEEELEKAKKTFDIIIFDGFIPKK